MLLIEVITDSKQQLAKDLRDNKGQGVKSIIKSAKRRSNADSDEKFTSDGVETSVEPPRVNQEN